MKKIIKLIFFPGMPAILFFAVMATFFYVLSFSEKQRSNIFTFIAYTITAYVLITVIADTPKALVNIKKALWGKGKSTCIIFSKEFRTKLALYFGWLLNLSYAAFKMFVSVLYNSFWFSIEAIYYLMLGVIRFSLVKFEKENQDSVLLEWKAYRQCGYLMLILNLLITIIINISSKNNKIYEYSNVVLYVSGGYTLYRLISSLIQMISFRKCGRPILSAAKAINISASALSLFTFFSTLITYSNKPTKEINDIISTVGWIVSFVVVGVSSFMVIRSWSIIKNCAKK